MGDLRTAARTLAREPGFALAVVVTLGLAVGVSAGLFGVVNALLLRPMPGVDASSLVDLYLTRDGARDGFSGFSYPMFRDLRERSRSLSALEAFVGRGFAIGDTAGSSIVSGQLVSGGFFELLGTRAHRGRLLTAADDTPAAAPVAVISHALWRDRFGGRDDVIGSTLRVSGFPLTVTGVAEAGFRGHFLGFPMDVFVPLAQSPRVAGEIDLEDRFGSDLELVGRVRPGLELRAAASELALLGADLARSFPESLRGRGVELRSNTGLDADLRRPVIGFVAVLFAVGGIVLLVACVNLAGLVLARGASRRRQLAVRAALGASRLALVRPLLVETLLLVTAGGLVGVALAAPAGHALHAFLPASVMPLQLDVSPDWRVAAFALAVTLVAGLAFGMAPASSATRVDVVEALKLDGRGVAPGRQAGRRAFVAAQVALSLVLLVGAGLFLRALQRARGLDPGFRIAGVGLVSVNLALLNRSPAASQTFFESWLERVRARPGVEAASLAGWLPLGFSRQTTRVLVDGLLPPGPEGFPATRNVVSPGFFDSLGIPLLAGRDFERRDGEAGERVAIVSRSTASRLFPGQEPLGRALRHEGQLLRVVGVVGDVVVERSGGREDLLFYAPFAQSRATRMTLIVRGAASPPLEVARRDALALEPDAPVLGTTSLAEHAATALFPQRLAAAVTGVFGIFGLMLASVGLYGIVAFFAGQRRRELAIRAALGARPRDLRRLVLMQGLRPVGAGVLVGLAGAAGFARLVGTLVPGMGGFDALPFAAGALVLIATAALAADLPARRAAASSPATGLRAD